MTYNYSQHCLASRTPNKEEEMDDLDDTLGQLSLSAKEWRPGQGFASSEPARQVSADSAASGGSSGWNGERPS